MSSERLIFQDVTALNQFNTGSDHRMLRAIVYVDKKLVRKRHFKNITHVDAYILKDKAEEFRTTLRNTHIQSESIENYVNVINNRLKKNLVETGIKVGKKRGKTIKKIQNAQ